MKKIIFISAVACILFACNNDGTKSTSETDTSTTTTNSEGTADNVGTNRDTASTGTTSIKADAATETFLKKAAEGGLAEVEHGNIAKETASDASVKNFATMMVNDHTAANAEVKALATSRSVTLPTAPPDNKKQHASQMAQKKGKDFDRAYMDMMVKDHKATIDLFEDAQNDTKDDQVKAFITNTLPKLKTHLDSAQAISKRIK